MSKRKYMSPSTKLKAVEALSLLDIFTPYTNTNKNLEINTTSHDFVLTATHSNISHSHINFITLNKNRRIHNDQQDINKLIIKYNYSFFIAQKTHLISNSKNTNQKYIPPKVQAEGAQ